MATCDFPDIQFVKAAGDGGPRPASQVVVIHLTDNTASDEAETAYATWRPDHTSAHFYNDEDSIIQAVPLSDIAFGCYPHGNRISIQFELVGREGAVTEATMLRAAPVVKRVCDKYGIPVRKIGPDEIRSGVKGICGHADITLAFPEDGGDHMDPGPDFAWDAFLSYVDGGLDMATLDEIKQIAQDTYWFARAACTGRDAQGNIAKDSWDGAPIVPGRQLADMLNAAKPAPVTVDAAGVAKALAADTDFLKALAKAVNDDAAARLAS